MLCCQLSYQKYQLNESGFQVRLQQWGQIVIKKVFSFSFDIFYIFMQLINEVQVH